MERFVDLLRRHHITTLVDVRSKPFSRWAPHFQKASLCRALTAQSVDYVFLGSELGGRPSGQEPPIDSKACFATYALADYLIDVSPSVNTRFAFQFMSLGDNDCDGGPYATPLVDLTPLPVAPDHAIVQAIGNEAFQGGLGRHIEGALRGLARYTPDHVMPGREMIGVLKTDGDPRGCEEDCPATTTW